MSDLNLRDRARDRVRHEELILRLIARLEANDRKLDEITELLHRIAGKPFAG
jgi:hypothetical protein